MENEEERCLPCSNKESKRPYKRFMNVLIIHTYLLDLDYVNKLNDVSKEMINIIFKNDKNITLIEKKIKDHQITLKKIINDQIYENIKEKQKELNNVIICSKIYRDIDNLYDSNFNIFKNLYNIAKNRWKDNEYEKNYLAKKIENHCICNQEIKKNIILFHKDKEINIIIGNHCIDTFSTEIESKTQEITISELNIWKEKFFSGLNELNSELNQMNDNSKKIENLKPFTKSNAVINRSNIDKITSLEEKITYNSYTSFKRNGVLLFKSFDDLLTICNINTKICDYYCPQEEKYKDNFNIELLLNDSNVVFKHKQEIYKGYLDHFLKDSVNIFNSIGKIFQIIIYQNENFPVYIPNLKYLDNGIYHLNTRKIKISLNSGFVKYKFIKKQDVFKCRFCKNYEKISEGLEWKKNRTCYSCYTLYNKGYKKDSYHIYFPCFKVKDKLQTIKCEECKTDFEYNITKKCPIPYLTIKCNDCK